MSGEGGLDDIMASIRQAVTSDAPAPPITAPAATVEAAPAGLAPAGDVTLEALVRSMLEPMLKAWLDANLPEIVDRAAQAEIARLTRS